jgi:hypothetical protein
VCEPINSAAGQFILTVSLTLSISKTIPANESREGEVGVKSYPRICITMFPTNAKLTLTLPPSWVIHNG